MSVASVPMVVSSHCEASSNVISSVGKIIGARSMLSRVLISPHNLRAKSAFGWVVWAISTSCGRFTPIMSRCGEPAVRKVCAVMPLRMAYKRRLIS